MFQHTCTLNIVYAVIETGTSDAVNVFLENEKFKSIKHS